MDEKVLEKIIRREHVGENDFTKFIASYLDSINKSYTSEQIRGIVIAFQHGIFNLKEFVEKEALKLGWLITRTYDKDLRTVLKTTINGK